MNVQVVLAFVELAKLAAQAMQAKAAGEDPAKIEAMRQEQLAGLDAANAAWDAAAGVDTPPKPLPESPTP